MTSELENMNKKLPFPASDFIRDGERCPRLLTLDYWDALHPAVQDLVKLDLKRFKVKYSKKIKSRKNSSGYPQNEFWIRLSDLYFTPITCLIVPFDKIDELLK